MARKNESVEAGTGDVFKDLGFADADERKLRTQLAMRLNDLLKERKLTQIAVAQIFGIPQPHISELRNYKLSRFSSERLLHFITLLDKDVEIVIRPKAANHVAGRVSVLVAIVEKVERSERFVEVVEASSTGMTVAEMREQDLL